MKARISTRSPPTLPAAKQFNGGQACICPDYVFVREEQKSPLVEGFRPTSRRTSTTRTAAIKKDSIAQIVNDRNFARVKGLFDDAVAKGATVAVGGTLDAADLTIHPTMLTDVTPQMKILQEEIFAPVAAGDDLRDHSTRSIDYIEARDKPLALYVYSHDQANVEKVLEPHLIRRRDGQRGVLALSGEPAAVRRRQRERHGQLSRCLRLQGLLPRAGDLRAPEPLAAS